MHSKRWTPRLALAVVLVGLLAPSGGAIEDSSAEPGDDQAFEELHVLAQGLQAETTSDDKPTPLTLCEKPLLRFDDPVRHVPVGGLWVLGNTGRPAAAVCTFQLELGGSGQVAEAIELVALNSVKFKVEQPGKWKWEPAVEQTWQSIDKAPLPADGAEQHLAQLRALANRFAATSLDPQNVTHPLVLSDKPLHRYSEPANGLVDGALFAFSHGTNPETLLLIECRTVAGQNIWNYEGARLSADEMTLTLDKAEVIHWMRGAGRDAKSPYVVRIAPRRAKH